MLLCVCVSRQVAFVMPPLMAYWMKMGAKIRKAQMKQTDQRSKQITEVLTSIRIIKFMSWVRSLPSTVLLK